MVRTGPDTSKRLPRHLRNEDIPTHTFTPPTYQVELLDAALHRNTIVCLGATSGKMFLAVMVLRELSYQLRKPLKEGGKRSVYLTDNDAFVDQQVQIIQHHTDLNVCQHLNKDITADWTTTQWQDLISSNHILFMSSHVLNYLFEENILPPADINVLIFEDCHVVNKDPIYSQILQNIKDTCSEWKPRILGLTSSVTATRCQNPAELESTITTLESKLDAVAETSTLIMSQRYGIWPKEEIFTCEKYDDSTGTTEILENILLDALDFLEDFTVKEDEENETKSENDPSQISKTVMCECLNILYKLGPWCAASIAQMFITQLEKMEKQETEALAKRFLRFSSTQLRMVNTVFDNNFTPDYDVNELLLYASPKVRKLVNHLRNYKPDCDFMIISSEDMDGMMGDNESDMSDDSEFNDTDDENGEENKRSNVIHVAIKKEGSEDSVKKASDPFSTDVEKYLCGIVFVDHRFVAIALNKFLEEVCSWDETLCFVKSHQITGQKKKNLRKDVNKKQEDILRKFRLQDLNLLISTNLLEDGIDVPRCNMIVKFDPPKDYRSYSRSKGLARAKDAEYLVLIDDFKAGTFKEDLQMFKGVEKDSLIKDVRGVGPESIFAYFGPLRGYAPRGNSQSLLPPVDQVLIGVRQNKEREADVETVEDDLDCIELLPPYYPNPDMLSFQVNLCNAIALVNRYCAKLPSDAFTHLTPKCVLSNTQVNGSTMFQAKLRLPINSPVKVQVMSDLMPTRSLAKRAVALKMCEILHKEGELDDQLAPIGKELFSLEEDDSSEWEDEDLMGEARPGTTKRKQYYLKKTASIMLNGYPDKGRNNLYLLRMKLTKPISDDQNTRGRKLNDPEDTSRSFGLLTSVEIPQVPEFPVYTRSGEVTVTIDLLRSDVHYSKEERDRLSDFHRFLFSNVLRLEKDPMIYQPNIAELGYLIIPLAKASEESAVDWNFIEKVEKYKLHQRRNIYDTEREMFTFTKDEYEDAVVMPGYRNIDQPQHFYVAEIRMDLNPASPFPSPELYKTFAEYYTTKYGLSITNYEQPLLDVDHTSARLNLLTPRYLNQKGVALPTSSAETKKARRENLQQKQILIPELCEVHVFPASFWKKAVCLPTILYRMNCLLVSEELRILISDGAGIGQVNIPEGYIFDPLSFSFLTDDESSDFTIINNNDGKYDDENELENDQQREISDDVTSVEKTCDINSLKKDLDNSNAGNLDDGTLNKDDVTFHDVDNLLTNQDKHENSSKVCENKTNIPGQSSEIQNIPPQNIVSNETCDDSSTVTSEFEKLELSKSENENNMNKEIEQQMNQSVDNSNASTESSNLMKNCNGNASDDVFAQIEHFGGGQDEKKKKEEDIEVTEEELNSLMSFDTDVDTETFIGPSPCMILQAQTMSNANDFFSLERLETIGDSFLKYAITVYLYCTYPGVHEGKLSYLRSKQVSNCNLYRLGKKKGLAECMISTKFEPYENWLPPGYYINEEKRKGPVPKVLLATKVDKIQGSNSSVNFCDIKINNNRNPHHLTNGWTKHITCSEEESKFNKELMEIQDNVQEEDRSDSSECLIPFCLQTLHSLPDKSIADCVESLIGCYLTSCGKKVALRFMSWLGLRVLPQTKLNHQISSCESQSLASPSSPLLVSEPDSMDRLEHLLIGFDELEEKIHYKFKDRSYLLQAFTHASYHYNTVTDCYQRLEFLGDAILDYVITRHLYEDSCKYSPGVLTDLRSALVNNNIFAALAVKWDFHKFFKAISPPLFNVIEKFVTRQKEREDEIDLEDEEEEVDDEVKVELEVPKALGDIFESLAGAIYLDSGMSLDTVWRAYYRIMKPQIDKYLKSIPKSPVRELLEMEPETAKFEKPERTLDGKIRVSVNVVSKGIFTGVGRNYRIAKSAAAKKALRGIRTMQAQGLVQ